MNYTAILKRAAHITWRYRALWLFGVLLAIFGGRGGGGDGGGGSAGQAVNMFQYRIGRQDLRWLQFNWGLVLGIVLVALAFVLVLIAVSIVVSFLSEGALIDMVDEIERTEATSVTSGFRTGWARLLHLFAITLLIDVPAAIAALLLLVIPTAPLLLTVAGAAMKMPAVAVAGVVMAIGLFLLWILFAIVLAIALGVLKVFAWRRSVLEGEGIVQSIGEGYQMIRRNQRDAGLTWLLLFGIGLVVGVVLFPVVLFGIAFFAGPGFLAWAISRSILVAIAAAAPFLLVFIAAMLFVSGLYVVFQSAVWTLLYREIAARERGAGAVRPRRRPL